MTESTTLPRIHKNTEANGGSFIHRKSSLWPWALATTFHGEGSAWHHQGLGCNRAWPMWAAYQGPPVSHLLDVMVSGKPYMESSACTWSCSNESSAAAMLGAHHPLPAARTVTWKSIVGTQCGGRRPEQPVQPRRQGRCAIIVARLREGASVIQDAHARL